jgi:hypothetical protein
MATSSESSSRRDFMVGAGALVTSVALTACTPETASAQTIAPPLAPNASADWDLSWLSTVSRATDRAIFDWPSLGDPADAVVLQFAERYLDNCRTVYGTNPYDARAVLNIRTQAVPAALADSTWERFSLGAEYNVKDPNTKETATTRNPFWHRAPSPVPGITLPTLADLVDRGAIVLVCDFALGHLARRLAPKVGRSQEEVHRDLRGGFVKGAFAVPSGFYGLARAQNSGCAYIRV